MRGRHRSNLTDAQWAMIAPLLSSYDPPTADLREAANACPYLEKTGGPWRYLPTDFGARPTLRTRRDRFEPSGSGRRSAALPTRRAP